MGKDSIKVYGARWCGDCYRAKMILDNYHIQYQWIDIDQEPNANDYVGKVNNGNIVVPTIVFEDGSTLSEPSNRKLKKKIEQERKSRNA